MSDVGGIANPTSGGTIDNNTGNNLGVVNDHLPTANHVLNASTNSITNEGTSNKNNEVTNQVINANNSAGMRNITVGGNTVGGTTSNEELVTMDTAQVALNLLPQATYVAPVSDATTKVDSSGNKNEIITDNSAQLVQELKSNTVTEEAKTGDFTGTKHNNDVAAAAIDVAVIEYATTEAIVTETTVATSPHVTDTVSTPPIAIGTVSTPPVATSAGSVPAVAASAGPTPTEAAEAASAGPAPTEAAVATGPGPTPTEAAAIGTTPGATTTGAAENAMDEKKKKSGRTKAVVKRATTTKKATVKKATTSTGIKKRGRKKKVVTVGASGKPKPKVKKRGRPGRPRKNNPIESKPDKPPKKKSPVVVYDDANDGDNNFYEVEKIVNAKRDPNDGVVYYKVRWKGYKASDDTWEPSTNLCDTAFKDAIKKFQLEKSYGKFFLKQQQKQKQKMNHNLVHELLKEEPVESVVEEEEGENELDDGDEKMDEDYVDSKESTNTEVKKRRTHKSTAVKSADERKMSSDLWQWTDEEQIQYRDVERIHVHNDSDAQQRVIDARLNGVPIILVGHVGYPQFAKRWIRKKEIKNNEIEVNTATETDENGMQSLEEPPRKRIAHKSTSVTATGAGTDEKGFGDHDNGWLDLSKHEDYELDVNKMIDDIGNESVPVLKPNYNEQSPIQGEVPAATFLKRFWPSKEHTAKKQILKKLYLHQWQFPLSSSASQLLCSDSDSVKTPAGGSCCNPLPDHIMGIDLLKYWLDPNKCNKDNPYQYLFMGTKDTVSKLHNDKGGLDIAIAPIIGSKEVLLVHRSDALSCLYHLNAKLNFDNTIKKGGGRKRDYNKIDLHNYPLMYHARIWRTRLDPGEILIMPYNTYHQTKNITPCLSYSRFYLDHINLKPFLDSLLINDATEIIHHEIIWNSTTELRDQLNDYLTEYKEKPMDLSKEIINLINTLRTLRNICRELTRRLHIEQRNNGSTGSNGSGSSGTHQYNSFIKQSIPNEGDRDPKIWDQLINEIDIALHEFQYRSYYHDPKKNKIPAFKKRRTEFYSASSKRTAGEVNSTNDEGTTADSSNKKRKISSPTSPDSSLNANSIHGKSSESGKYSYGNNQEESNGGSRSLQQLHLKDAFEFYLPNLTPVQHLSTNISDKDLASLQTGSKVSIKFMGKFVQDCEILDICENMTAAYLQYIDDGHCYDNTNTRENYSNEFYHEYQPLSKLRLPSISDGDGAVNHTEILSLQDLLLHKQRQLSNAGAPKSTVDGKGMVVINYWGKNNEEYRAIVQSWKICTFYRISLQFAAKGSLPGNQPLKPYIIERWLTRDHIFEKYVVSEKSNNIQKKDTSQSFEKVSAESSKSDLNAPTTSSTNSNAVASIVATSQLNELPLSGPNASHTLSQITGRTDPALSITGDSNAAMNTGVSSPSIIANAAATSVASVAATIPHPATKNTGLQTVEGFPVGGNTATHITGLPDAVLNTNVSSNEPVTVAPSLQSPSTTNVGLQAVDGVSLVGTTAPAPHITGIPGSVLNNTVSNMQVEALIPTAVPTPNVTAPAPLINTNEVLLPMTTPTMNLAAPSAVSITTGSLLPTTSPYPNAAAVAPTADSNGTIATMSAIATTGVAPAENAFLTTAVSPLNVAVTAPVADTFLPVTALPQNVVAAPFASTTSPTEMQGQNTAVPPSIQPQ